MSFEVVDANGNLKTNQLSVPVALSKGGTHADLSATGGAHKFLQQATTGADIAVVQPVWADIDKTTSSLADVATRTLSTLSDYSVGTWTPSIVATSGSATQSIQSGYFINIGKLVVVFFTVRVASAGTLSGNISISGLPFTVLNDSNLRGYFPVRFTNFNSNWVEMMVGGTENSTKLLTVGSKTVTSSVNDDVTAADLTTNSTLSGIAIYIAA